MDTCTFCGQYCGHEIWSEHMHQLKFYSSSAPLRNPHIYTQALLNFCLLIFMCTYVCLKILCVPHAYKILQRWEESFCLLEEELQVVMSPCGCWALKEQSTLTITEPSLQLPTLFKSTFHGTVVPFFFFKSTRGTLQNRLLQWNVIATFGMEHIITYVFMLLMTYVTNLTTPVYNNIRSSKNGTESSSVETLGGSDEHVNLR